MEGANGQTAKDPRRARPFSSPQNRFGMSLPPAWSQFQSSQTAIPSLGLTLDISRMGCSPETLPALAPKFDQAFAEMARLEQGAIANPDENRMVVFGMYPNPVGDKLIIQYYLFRQEQHLNH